MAMVNSKAYIQFSKKIATLIAIFWCSYRALQLVLIWLKPELGTSLAALSTGVDDVMMVSVGFYTGNSVIEKGITGYFSRETKDSRPAARKPSTEKTNG